MNSAEQEFRAKLGIKSNDFYSSLLAESSESSELRIEKVESQQVEVSKIESQQVEISKIETRDIESNRGYVSYNVDSEAVPVLEKLNLKSSSFMQDEKLINDVLSKAGPAVTYQRSDYSQDIASLGIDKDVLYTKSVHNLGGEVSQSAFSLGNTQDSNLVLSTSSLINQDPSPIRVLKPASTSLVYRQQVSVRYLQPPTPPPAAPIIIREKQAPQAVPQPPIIIRQTEPFAPTPPPLTIREKAPSPPRITEATIIERTVPAPPPPPRQVIIERIPAPPQKPRAIVYEKWLPYKQIRRPVIIQRCKAEHKQQAPPKNVIIEYERPKAIAIRNVIEEGIFRVDPIAYQQTVPAGEVRYVDKITDLPIENSRILAQLKAEERLAASEGFTIEKLLSNPSSSIRSSQESNQIPTEYQTFASSLRSKDCPDYETFTTIISEMEAEKIIAEARASGAMISKSEVNLRASK